MVETCFSASSPSASECRAAAPRPIQPLISCCQCTTRRANNSFSEMELWNVFIQICLALKYLHDKRILHRDLKSQVGWRARSVCARACPCAHGAANRRMCS